MRSPTPTMTTTEIMLATSEVRTCAHSTDERTIGIEWNLSKAARRRMFGDRLDDFAGEVRALLGEPFCRGYFLGLAGRYRSGNGPQARASGASGGVTVPGCV